MVDQLAVLIASDGGIAADRDEDITGIAVLVGEELALHLTTRSKGDVGDVLHAGVDGDIAAVVNDDDGVVVRLHSGHSGQELDVVILHDTASAGLIDSTRRRDYNMYLNAYIKEHDNQKYFDYLERLRQSGETNMYGAAPYLQAEFPELRYDRNKAGDILLAWIRTFDKREDGTSC